MSSSQPAQRPPSSIVSRIATGFSGFFGFGALNSEPVAVGALASASAEVRGSDADAGPTGASAPVLARWFDIQSIPAESRATTPMIAVIWVEVDH